MEPNTKGSGVPRKRRYVVHSHFKLTCYLPQQIHALRRSLPQALMAAGMTTESGVQVHDANEVIGRHTKFERGFGCYRRHMYFTLNPRQLFQLSLVSVRICAEAAATTRGPR